MSLSLTEYRTKLMAKIMNASSQDEVKRYIDAAVKSLDQNKVNGHFILRFIDKMSDELEAFSPMNKNEQQWSNIKMSLICFNRIKRTLEKISFQ